MLRDCSGSVLVEFAFLAPVLIIALIGVVEVGLHLRQHNAVRNLAADGARNAVVQYQRGIEMTAQEVADDIEARGIGPKFALTGDRLDVDVDVAASRIAGVREMHIAVTYDAPNLLSSLIDIDALQIQYERPVFLLIPAAPAA